MCGNGGLKSAHSWEPIQELPWVGWGPQQNLSCHNSELKVCLLWPPPAPWSEKEMDSPDSPNSCLVNSTKLVEMVWVGLHVKYIKWVFYKHWKYDSNSVGPFYGHSPFAIPCFLGKGVSQWFRGQVGPILGIFKCSFTPLQIRFIESLWKLQHINELLTPCARCMHDAHPQQAKKKSNDWCEIKPVQEKNLKYFNQKCTTFFCLKIQPKQNLFLKGHWENFKIGGVPKQTKRNFMNKQTLFYVMSWGKWN